MIERSGHAVAPTGKGLDEHELERRFGDGKIGVARVAIGWFGCEQLGVERHGSVEVCHIEGELDSGHHQPPLVSTVIDAFIMIDAFSDVNERRRCMAKRAAVMETADNQCCPSVFTAPL